MRKYYLVAAMLSLLATVAGIYSCSKQERTDSPEKKLTDKEKLSMKIFGNKDFKYNKADLAYMQALKQFTADNKFKAGQSGMTTTGCTSSGGLSTYGYYSDYENIAVEGPYSAAVNATYENDAANCLLTQNVVANAYSYLYSQGYGDIIGQIQEENPNLVGANVVHTANSLLFLKSHFAVEPVYEERIENVRDCLLKALGADIILHMVENWEGLSRQYLIKAFKKLATRYLGWYGVAWAIISFVDCMW